MKAYLAGLAIIAGACVATAGLSAQPEPTAQPGPWVLIGTTKAKHTDDHDTLYIRNSETAFRQLKIGVKGASLHMQRFVVTYGNGLKDDIPVAYKIPKNSESRPINLHGKHRITQVDYWYDTKGWLNGSANVSLYARR